MKESCNDSSQLCVGVVWECVWKAGIAAKGSNRSRGATAKELGQKQCRGLCMLARRPRRAIKDSELYNHYSGFCLFAEIAK